MFAHYVIQIDKQLIQSHFQFFCSPLFTDTVKIPKPDRTALVDA